MSDLHDRGAETLRAWDLAAGKYAEEIEVDVAALLTGGLELSPPEREVLLPLVSRSTRLLHLQCSHGQSALGLWRASGSEVVGVDGSAAMLAIAREKARRLEVPAGSVRFMQADVLAAPREHTGRAAVLLTGSGALPWVADLTRWGQVVAGLLAPDGWLVLYEAHPLKLGLGPTGGEGAVPRRAVLLRRASGAERRLPGACRRALRARRRGRAAGVRAPVDARGDRDGRRRGRPAQRAARRVPGAFLTRVSARARLGARAAATQLPARCSARGTGRAGRAHLTIVAGDGPCGIVLIRLALGGLAGSRNSYPLGALIAFMQDLARVTGKSVLLG